MFDFEDINRILDEMVEEGMVEPIDDPAFQTDFYDWADVVGILDEIEPDSRFVWRKALPVKYLRRGRAAPGDVSAYIPMLYDKIFFLKIFCLTSRY